MYDIDMELLIALVENKPVLWDKTQECYNKRQSSYAAWKDVCVKLKENFVQLSEKQKNDFGKDVIKKWTNARDNWMKYHKKVKQLKSGAVAKIQRKYKYYDQMLFLSRIVNRRTSDASTTSEENLTQSHNQETNLQSNNEPSSPSNSSFSTEKNKRRTEDVSEVGRQTLTLRKSAEDEGNSKSMSFFKSIVPIVDKYNDEDYIEFQYEVIKIMRKFTGRNQTFMQQQNGQ